MSELDGSRDALSSEVKPGSSEDLFAAQGQAEDNGKPSDALVSQEEVESKAVADSTEGQSEKQANGNSTQTHDCIKGRSADAIPSSRVPSDSDDSGSVIVVTQLKRLRWDKHKVMSWAANRFAAIQAAQMRAAMRCVGENQLDESKILRIVNENSPCGDALPRRCKALRKALPHQSAPIPVAPIVLTPRKQKKAHVAPRKPPSIFPIASRRVQQQIHRSVETFRGQTACVGHRSRPKRRESVEEVCMWVCWHCTRLNALAAHVCGRCGRQCPLTRSYTIRSERVPNAQKRRDTEPLPWLGKSSPRAPSPIQCDPTPQLRPNRKHRRLQQRSPKQTLRDCSSAHAYAQSPKRSNLLSRPHPPTDSPSRPSLISKLCSPLPRRTAHHSAILRGTQTGE